MTNFSSEHMEFLQKKKKRKKQILFLRLFIVFLLFCCWEVCAKFEIINSFLWSSPSKILSTFLQLYHSGDLFHHIGITCFEVLISFLISMILGLFISILMWWNSFFSKVIDPYITVFNSLPKVALGPLIIIWCGASIHSVIFMGLLISSFVTILNIYSGFVTVPDKYTFLLHSFHANKWQTFRYVIFPYNRSNIISTLKVNISMNLIGVIMGELLVSKQGLGYLIMYGSQVFNINLVITAVSILAIISCILYGIISHIEKRLIF